MTKEYAKRFATDTALEVVTPDSLPGSESDPLSLHLDQTTPQTILNGPPNFSAGLRFTETTELASIADTLGIYAFDKNGFTTLQSIDGAGNTLQFFRDNVRIVRNVSGSEILACKVVAHAGTATGNITNIILAKADSTATMPSIGFTLDTIAHNGFGRVMFMGSLKCNTNAFNEGDTLYVSEITAGEATNVAPTFPNFRQEVGQVLVKGVGNGVADIDIRTARGTEYYDGGYLRLNGSNANTDIDIGNNNLFVNYISIASAVNASMTLNYGDGNFFNFGDTTGVRIYAYNTANNVYSATALQVEETDNSGFDSLYYVSITWDAVAGADSYRVFLKNGNFGLNYDYYEVIK